jgi:hypothetical protein
MVLNAALLAIILQAAQFAGSADKANSLHQIQYRYGHPPPCGDGFDVSARDGMCYPNGYLPPQDQAARQGQYYGGRRYPVPCGNGSDIDIRDGQCYLTGTVPRRYQQARQYQYRNQRRVPRRYYEGY